MSHKITLPINEIIYLYSVEGYSAMEISKLYHVSNCTIGNVLRQYNIPYNILPSNFTARHNPNSAHKITFDQITVNEIIRLYTQEHMASPEIGKKFGVCFPKIIQTLKEHNVPVLDSRHDHERGKLIHTTNIPEIFKNPLYVNHKLTGEVTCPTCSKTRRLLIGNISRMNDIIKSEGRCLPCAQMKRVMSLDFKMVLHLYEHDKLTYKQIGRMFHVSEMPIRNLFKIHKTKMRKKGELRKREIINKGTLGNPELGDVCRGTDVGINDPSFYVYVQCDRCKLKRWQSQSHMKRSSPLCLECATTRLLENKGTIETPILGDIQKGTDVGKRSTAYYQWIECQDCHKYRWLIITRVGKYLRCTDCAHKLIRGENSSNWLGGLSFEPYGLSFNNELKEQIRKRDHYTCQLCGKPQNGKKLSTHHIDYNKRHNHPRNLISLCSNKKDEPGCHAKTNNNREYWIKYFQDSLIKRFPEYDYSIIIPDDKNLRGYKRNIETHYCPKRCEQYPQVIWGTIDYTCNINGIEQTLKRKHIKGKPFICRKDCPLNNDMTCLAPDNNPGMGVPPKRVGWNKGIKRKRYCPKSCEQYPMKRKRVGCTCCVDGLIDIVKRDRSVAGGYAKFICKPNCPKGVRNA